MNMWSVAILALIFVVVCLMMILVILIQKPRGGGLSGAFGGAGGSAQSVFGSKTGDVATWFTVAMFVCFMLLAMGMQWTINPFIQSLSQDIDTATSDTLDPTGAAADETGQLSAGAGEDTSASGQTAPSDNGADAAPASDPASEGASP